MKKQLKIRIKIGICCVALCLGGPKTTAQYAPDHKVSLDKGNIGQFVGLVDRPGERKVYRGEELQTIGMPCGGIMAGQLYVRGDGTLAQIRAEGKQENRVVVKYGRLHLRRLNLSVVSPGRMKGVKVYHNGKEIPSSFRLHKQVEVSFEPIELTEGDELKVVAR